MISPFSTFRAFRVRVAPESLFLVAAALLCTAVLSVLATDGYWADPMFVAPAVMMDLTLGLPFLGYLFLVRTRRSDHLILIPLFLFGAFLARWWIPEPHRLASDPVRLAGVVLEGVVLILLAVRVGRIRQVYSAERDRFPYPSDAMELAFVAVLGRRLGAAIFGEGAAIWYALRGWGRVRDRRPDSRVFPDLKRSGYPAILGALVLLILIETAVLHLLIGLWNGRVAWALSGLGVYSVLWLLGDFNAARHQPTFVDDLGLHLRSGLRWRVDVPWQVIRGLRDEPPEGRAVKMTRFGKPDLWVELDEPQTARGLLGIRRQTELIGLGLDDPDAFRTLLENRLSCGGAVPS